MDTARDLDQLRRAVGDRKLTYLGISYGTILGATYANMFPSSVRALVLDSNIAPDAWTNDNSDDARLPIFLRMGSDRTAAATVNQFLSLCGAAPTERCAFSAGSPEVTRKKYEELKNRLRESPVGPWTYARTVAESINHLYIVHPRWTDLAVLLQELWEGRVPEPAPFPPADPVPYPVPYMGEEQTAAVECGDTLNPRDPRVYHRLAEASAARTGDAGRFWTWAAEPCATWPAEAEYRYTGPWNKPTPPVLVVGTIYDPSIPYSNAQAMAKELANARLLTNTPGTGTPPCSTPAAASTRTRAATSSTASSRRPERSAHRTHRRSPRPLRAPAPPPPRGPEAHTTPPTGYVLTARNPSTR
ncbi:alpha/beta fold hydrolase [Streptomyces sp. NBC_01353]|uniref:alpha/beta fold hydrolase n=1 Tax=Streptomyces sp. NBC_01353 TaxID=2903835 RepID=UPI002E313E27|nr:alpha/beta fold hydrolase [Streptomyces sp. NBC_01353]